MTFYCHFFHHRQLLGTNYILIQHVSSISEMKKERIRLLSCQKGDPRLSFDKGEVIASSIRQLFSLPTTTIVCGEKELALVVCWQGGRC